jgi:hypothetical protein
MLLLLATLLLPHVFSGLLDVEREICHGDVYWGVCRDWRLKTRWGCFSDLFWFAFSLENK